MGVWIADDFLDLPIPLDDGCLQSLNQIFILPITIRQVFLRDVKLSIAFNLEASFGDRCHEFVKLGKEFLFHIIWPRSFIHDRWNEDGIHESHQAL